MRGAECGTDHLMLRLKLQVLVKSGSHKPRRGENAVGRFDVTKLCGPNVDDRGELTERALFQESVGKKVKESWNSGGSIEEKWKSIKSALCESAELVLGRVKRGNPDWFQESSHLLKPLFEERNRLYTKWLGSGKEDDKKRFLRLRREAKRGAREAKNSWFLRKAAEAQKGQHGGKVVWRCIRDIQRGRKGLVPRRSTVLKDEEGNICKTLEQQQQRWKRHFTEILNVQSKFDPAVLVKARQRPLRPQMADPPLREELEAAICKLKRGKAGGSSGILPEMVRVATCGEEFLDALLKLVEEVWKESSVPRDWSNAVLVPIPKKGDLSNCDNWRGIALLDVVGKVVARVLQERLQELSEEELPESQCGFRKGRSCTDMTFTVRQLVEKSWEHRTKLFMTFIDLKKAYDSIPRCALWTALRKLGVPEKTIQLIRSFHQNMEARISLEGELSEAIEVENDLRQGCCMAPVLFNLYTCLMMECWHAKVKTVAGVGVELKYKVDKKLFRRYTQNALQRELTECMFADDGALLASTRAGAEVAVTEFQSTSSDFGLTVSIPKTKHMVAGREVEDCDRAPIPVRGGEVASVGEFPYLGSIVATDGRVDVEVERRISQASRAFGALRKPVFLDRNLRLETKRKIYQACVLSVLLYGSECWTMLRKHMKKLDAFHHRCIRTIRGITNKQQWTQCIISYEVRRRWGDLETASEKVMKRRLQWLGHLARMSDDRIPKTVLFGWLTQPRPRSGPRKRWRDMVKKDLQQIKVKEEEWYDEAVLSREGWRATCRLQLATQQEARPTTRPTEQAVTCDVCCRSFRRESDRKRHKCRDERQKPISEQKGATQCPSCCRWFHSKGGLAVHRCHSAYSDD